MCAKYAGVGHSRLLDVIWLLPTIRCVEQSLQHGKGGFLPWSNFTFAPDGGGMHMELFEQMRIGGHSRVYFGRYGSNDAVFKIPKRQAFGSADSECLRREAFILHRIQTRFRRRHELRTPELYLYSTNPEVLIMERLPISLSSQVQKELESAADDVQERVRHVAGGVLQVLKYLHVDCKIIHRDIKIGNLMLKGGDWHNVHLIDFGLAWPMHIPQDVHEVGPQSVVSGDARCMSRAQHERRKQDWRTDLEGLVHTLLDMLHLLPWAQHHVDELNLIYTAKCRFWKQRSHHSFGAGKVRIPWLTDVITIVKGLCDIPDVEVKATPSIYDALLIACSNRDGKARRTPEKIHKILSGIDGRTRFGNSSRVLK